jgi:hypothetical protein
VISFRPPVAPGDSTGASPAGQCILDRLQRAGSGRVASVLRVAVFKFLPLQIEGLEGQTIEAQSDHAFKNT